MTKDIEYGNQRYQQGYEAGYEEGFAKGTVAEVQEDTWDDGFNEGFEAGEQEGYNDGFQTGKTEGFDEGVQAEQKRIQTVIRMHMEWAKRDNKGRDFIFWNNVADALKHHQIPEMSEDEWRQELENLGF